MTGYVCHVGENIPGAIYIGRAVPRRKMKTSPFANPYVIGSDAANVPERIRPLMNLPLGREGALLAYAYSIWDGGELAHLIGMLPGLRDKPLACWCRRSDEAFGNGADGSADNRCHGDLLLDWLETYTDDQLRSFIKEN